MIHIVSGHRVSRRGPEHMGQVFLMGEWLFRVTRGDGHEDDYGIVSRKIITKVAIAEILKVLAAGTSAALGNFRFHALGTGISPESSNDTALAAEVGSRTQGTQQTTATQYITAATIVATVGTNISEAGIFSGNNVLLDRSRFAAFPVAIGNQVSSTFKLTVVGS